MDKNSLVIWKGGQRKKRKKGRNLFFTIETNRDRHYFVWKMSQINIMFETENRDRDNTVRHDV